MNLAVKCLKTGQNSIVAGIMFEALTTSKPVMQNVIGTIKKRTDLVPKTWKLQRRQLKTYENEI
jgi:hypothetical protein